MPLDLQPHTERNVDYQILCRASREAIADEARLLLEQGWHRCGHVGGRDGAYYQPMVKFLL